MAENERDIRQNLTEKIQTMKVESPGVHLLALIALEENPHLFVNNLISRWDEVRYIAYPQPRLTIPDTEVLKISENDTIVDVAEAARLRGFNLVHMRRIISSVGGIKVKGKWYLSLGKLDEYIAEDPRRKARAKR